MQMLINKTQIRKFTKDKNVSQETYRAIEDEVKELVRDAMERAEGNDRNTVMARDV